VQLMLFLGEMDLLPDGRGDCLPGFLHFFGRITCGGTGVYDPVFVSVGAVY